MRILMIHGYDYAKSNWNEVMWGFKGLSGRIPRGIAVAQHFSIEFLIMGSCIFKNIDTNMVIHKELIDRICKLKKFSQIISDWYSQRTVDEVEFVSHFLEKGDELFVVSDYVHLPRCLNIAWEKLNNVGIIGFPSDIPYQQRAEIIRK